MLAIERQEETPLCRCKGQHFSIGYGATRIASIETGDNVMT